MIAAIREMGWARWLVASVLGVTVLWVGCVGFWTLFMLAVSDAQGFPAGIMLVEVLP